MDSARRRRPRRSMTRNAAKMRSAVVWWFVPVPSYLRGPASDPVSLPAPGPAPTPASLSWSRSRKAGTSRSSRASRTCHLWRVTASAPGGRHCSRGCWQTLVSVWRSPLRLDPSGSRRTLLPDWPGGCRRSCETTFVKRPSAVSSWCPAYSGSSASSDWPDLPSSKRSVISPRNFSTSGANEVSSSLPCPASTRS